MRRLWLAPALLATGLAVAILDGDSGLRSWWRLRDDLASARVRIEGLEEERSRLEAEVTALESDPFALERAIREDLELARPGELVVRFRRPAGPGLELP
jgi:cell division protein FtsB